MEGLGLLRDGWTVIVLRRRVAARKSPEHNQSEERRKTATCAQYQLPPRYMVTMSMTYVAPHPIMNTPKSVLITGTGVRKRDIPIARILGIAKYAKAMLKLEKTINPIISGDDARQTPCGTRSDMIGLLIGSLTQMAFLKIHRWGTSLIESEKYRTALSRSAEGMGFNRN
jgi:hypothetical protein